jgi:hypothetical protein
MLQSITINQMDNGNNSVSRLGLEGISSLFKDFGSCDQNTQVKGLRLVHS